jgi:Asp-tRNA(Asn)/Glu-tRNA(Gln) amidotransferase A subunit family amidase
MADFFEEYDLLLCPTNAVPAFPIGRRPREIDGQPIDTLWGPFPFTAPFNLTGQPAISVPCGFAADGLPIGLQIVGRLGDDVTVLRAAAAFEEARPWAEAKPALAMLRG